MAFDSVLLIGFGGPTQPDEIRPFLQRVTRGRSIPPERLEDVAHHYELIGGRSPFNDLTFRQVRALEARLAALGLPLPVYVGMRNWHPFLTDTVRQMAEAGACRTVGVILAAHRTEASFERYQQDVVEAQQAVPSPLVAPAVEYIRPWYSHPGFIEAQAQRLEAATGQERNRWPVDLPVVFTAHSVPVEMADRSPYVSELNESARLVSEALGVSDWSLAFQSRSGSPRQPWLEPDVNDVIRELAGRGIHRVALAPIGFLCDHVEVLYDLDVEARQTAAERNVKLYRAGTVGDHPTFIEALAERVQERARAG